MLTNPTPSRRTAGRLMVLAAVAIALPLTATTAINYVDVPAPAEPAAPAAPASLAVQPAALVAPVAPVAPSAPVQHIIRPNDDLSINGEMVTINGRAKHWKELTPEEKAEIRRSIAQAKAELARTRIDRAEIEREIREAMNGVKIDQEALRRDLAEARIEIDRAMREVDSHAGEIRRSGQDPEVIKAQVRASLKAIEAIDVEAITRNALASVDHETIAASVAVAEESIAKAQAEVERIEERLEQGDE